MPALPTARGTPGHRHRAGPPARRSRPASRLVDPCPLRRLHIRLPRVDRYPDGRVAARTPQLPTIEAHRIKPLRIFARADGVAVGKNVTSDDAFDGADVAAHIAGQAGVGERLNILAADVVCRVECSCVSRV